MLNILRYMRYSFATSIISALFILLFTYTAISKILDYENFKIQLSSFPYLPFFIKYFVWVIPLSELIIVALLTLYPRRLAGFYASTFLLILFTIYLFAVIMFAPDIPCTCGGILQQLSWKAHIIFNSSFILLGLIGIWLEKLKRKTSINQSIVATNRGIRKPE